MGLPFRDFCYRGWPKKLCEYLCSADHCCANALRTSLIQRTRIVCLGSPGMIGFAGRMGATGAPGLTGATGFPGFQVQAINRRLARSATGCPGK